MKKLIATATLLLIIFVVSAQKLGINTTNPQGVLDISSTTDGIMVPRLTTAQREAMTNVIEGKIIYNTTIHCLQVYNGFYWSCTDGSNKEGYGKIIFSNAGIGAIDKTADKGFIAAGFKMRVTTGIDPFTFETFNISHTDAFIQQLDSLGNEVWASQLFDLGSMADIHQTSAGEFVTVGSVKGDAVAIKLNAGGDTLWTKAYGGTQTDLFNAVAEMPDGHFIAAGTTFSNTGNVSGNHGNADIWLVKINAADGSIIWQKCIGGTGSEEAKSIRALTGGNFVIAGSSSSNDGDFSGNHGGDDAFVIKCYSAALPIGAMPFYTKLIGGSNDETMNSIDKTADGNFIMAGFTKSNNGDVSGYHGVAGSEPDAWIVKLDDVNSNDILWQKCFGNNHFDISTVVKTTADGGYIVGLQTGNLSPAFGMADMGLLKLTPAGAESWKAGVGGSRDDNTRGIVQNHKGEYIIAGNSQSTDFYIPEPGGVIFKFSNSGSIMRFK